jgi:hypothetical protein
MSAVLVATLASSPFGGLAGHARCVTQHHPCESAAAILDCCCKHVSSDGQSAATLTNADPQLVVSHARILPSLEHSSYAVPIAVDRPVPRPPLLQLDRVTLFGTLLI